MTDDKVLGRVTVTETQIVFDHEHDGGWLQVDTHNLADYAHGMLYARRFKNNVTVMIVVQTPEEFEAMMRQGGGWPSESD
jgi:uncharacterized protein YehS (DUF1456 family)